MLRLSCIFRPKLLCRNGNSLISFPPPCLQATSSFGILTEKNEDDRVAAQEHLADESVLVDLATKLSVCQSGRFRPHLFRVLQYHVAVTVESLYTGEQFAVVAAGNENLGARADSRLQDGERAGSELVFLDLGDFILAGRKVSAN